MPLFLSIVPWKQAGCPGFDQKFITCSICCNTVRQNFHFRSKDRFSYWRVTFITKPTMMRMMYFLGSQNVTFIFGDSVMKRKLFAKSKVRVQLNSIFLSFYFTFWFLPQSMVMFHFIPFHNYDMWATQWKYQKPGRITYFHLIFCEGSWFSFAEARGRVGNLEKTITPKAPAHPHSPPPPPPPNTPLHLIWG